MPTDQEILSLLADQESFRVERTRSVSDTEKFSKAVCAFSNDMPGEKKSGYLFVGVDENGNPSGATIDEKVLERLAQLKTNGQILPLPDIHVSRASVRGHQIAVVEVNPSSMPPVRYQGVTWIRTGPMSDRATQEQERRLEERRIDRSLTWDARGCPDSSIDDLALQLFELNYLPKAVAREVLDENGRSPSEQLSSLRLFSSRHGVPTHAAILAFGKNVLQFVPGAYVQYVRYAGTSLSTDVLEERHLSGDLLTVMTDLDRLARHVAVTRPVRGDDLSETLVSDYPEVALHEILMNAVIHRNYDGSTTPVSFNHFIDRIEIQSPGGLYGDLTREQFPNATAYRNPVIAEVAKVLGFANRFGRGIAVAQYHLKMNGSPALEPTIGTNHLLITVRKRP